MAITHRKTLDEYLALEYTFIVEADPDGGYVISFPDLPGCLSQVDDLNEIPDAVEEVRRLWLETAYEHDIEIPLPSYTEEASGKILVRMPKSLHRRLLDQSAREEVSLNQYAVSVLARGDAQASVERRLADVEQQLRYIHDHLRQYQVSAPRERQRAKLDVVVGGAESTRYAVAS